MSVLGYECLRPRAVCVPTLDVVPSAAPPLQVVEYIYAATLLLHGPDYIVGLVVSMLQRDPKAVQLLELGRRMLVVKLM